MYAMKRIAIFIFLLMFGMQNSEGQTPITWIDQVGVEEVGSDLISTAVGWGHVGAASEETLSSNLSWSVSMEAADHIGYRALGVSENNDNAHINSIDYMIYLYQNVWYYKINAPGMQTGYLSQGSFDVGDTFIISYNHCAEILSFTRVPLNGAPKSTIEVSVSLQDMIVDCAMYGGTNPVTTIRNVLINGNIQYSVDDLVFDDESAYLQNTCVLQELIDNTPDEGTLDLVYSGDGVLFIDEVVVSNSLTINGDEITLKRPIILGDVESLPEPLEEVDWSQYPLLNNLRWHRLMTVSNSELQQSFYLNDLYFDGSILEMNATYNTPYAGYEIEHSTLLFLNHPNNSNYSENESYKLNAVLTNCKFYNNGSDGVGVYRNVDFEMYDSEAHDCFRGGLTCTGGNSIITVDGFDTFGSSIPTGVDFEVNKPGTDANGDPHNGSAGNNGRWQLIVDLDNISLDADMDIGVFDESVVTVDNSELRSPGLRLYFKNSRGTFTNCDFKNGEMKVDLSHIFAFNDLTFNDCTFEVVQSEELLPLSCVPIVRDLGYQDQLMTFNSCKFISSQHENMVVGIPTHYSKVENSNKIVVDNSYFSSGIDNGIQTYNTDCGVTSGLDIEVKHSKFYCDYPYRTWGLAPLTPFNIKLECNYYESENFMYVAPWSTPSDGLNKLSFNNTILNQKSNTIYSILNASSPYSYNLDNIDVQGERLIFGNVPPTSSVNGLIGDFYINNNNLYECTESGYYSIPYSNDLSDCEEVPISSSTLNPATWVLNNQLATETLQAYDFCGNPIEFSTCNDLNIFETIENATVTEFGSISLFFESASCNSNQYSIMWDTGEVTADIDMLLPGEYCVTVRATASEIDCYDCIARKCFTVEGTNCMTPMPEFSEIISDASCGGGRGSIDLTVEVDECEDVSFQWSNGSFEEDISGLDPGKYCVTVTRTSIDKEGCSGEDCYTVKCYKVKSNNENCNYGFCKTDIQLSERHEGVLNPGEIDLFLSCELRESIWSFNGTEINNFDPANITVPGEYCFQFVDLQDCQGEICFDVGYCFEEGGCTICTASHQNTPRSIENYSMNVSPNPFTDRISVSCTKGINSISVFNINGQKVEEILIEGSIEYNLNSESLTTGIYYLHIQLSDGTTQIEKIIKINN